MGDLDDLLKLDTEDLRDALPCRIRRKLERSHTGVGHERLVDVRVKGLMSRLRDAKMLVANTEDKPKGIKTHLRNTVILPEMVGNIVEIYNGKLFNRVQLKP